MEVSVGNTILHIWKKRCKCYRLLHIGGNKIVRTPDFLLVSFRFPHQHVRGLAIERITWIRVTQKLRQELFEDVHHVWRSRRNIIPASPEERGRLVCVPNIGDQVWLMTSRHTEPLLREFRVEMIHYKLLLLLLTWLIATYNSSILGWNILFMKPMLGLLYGYWSGSSTWTRHTPPAKGAEKADVW